MEPVRILPMAQRHLDTLVRLEKICFSDPWTRAGLEEELSCPTAVFVAAEQGGEISGFAGMHCACGECYVDQVAVFPQLRRRGVGNALVRSLIARASEDKAEFISLEVRKSNSGAIAMYNNLGFTQAGLRRDFYRKPKEDALILTLYFEAAT